MPNSYSKYYGHESHDSSAMMVPIYNPQKNKKSSSRCFVYTFATFVFLCVSLFIIACIALPIKAPTLQINSMVIKSLNYDYSPSFKLTALLKISIKNRNFGYLEFIHKSNNTMSMLYGSGSSVLGTSELKLRNGLVKWRDEDEFVVEMKVNSVKGKVNLLKDYDRVKIDNDLGLGNLELVGFACIKSNVHFIKNKIKMSTIARMNCVIDIDLRKKIVRKIVC